jgi:hypothetical protein
MYTSADGTSFLAHACTLIRILVSSLSPQEPGYRLDSLVLKIGFLASGMTMCSSVVFSAKTCCLHLQGRRVMPCRLVDMYQLS